MENILTNEFKKCNIQTSDKCRKCDSTDINKKCLNCNMTFCLNCINNNGSLLYPYKCPVCFSSIKFSPINSV